MLYNLTNIRPHHCSHSDILMRSELLYIPGLEGDVIAMYPIDDQCRIELVCQVGVDDSEVPVWEYSFTMPIMCIAEHCTARTQVHFTASIAAPYSEEKLRYGCQLQTDCLVCPQNALQLAPHLYRLSYDAHVALYLTCHACCS